MPYKARRFLTNTGLDADSPNAVAFTVRAQAGDSLCLQKLVLCSTWDTRYHFSVFAQGVTEESGRVLCRACFLRSMSCKSGKQGAGVTRCQRIAYDQTSAFL